MKYFIKTFGCQMNDNDSNSISALLYQAGYSASTVVEEADIIIVNTCCVRESAENRAFGYIGSLKSLKEQKPALIIAICGCMAQKNGVAADLLRRYQHVGLILGTFAIPRLPKHLSTYRDRVGVIVDVEEVFSEPAHTPLPPPGKTAAFKAQINIIYGCDNYCTYCIVPYVRGREHSRQPQHIMEQVQALIKTGVKEIQLLGQNVNAYGKDFSDKEWNFARLLRELDALDGIERIRYMTSHPRDFNAELIETIASAKHICHHFHLPLQSGCDKILAAMNRGYDTEYYASLLKNIRSLMPNSTITSDLIVGFPGETDEDFQQTLDFIARIRLDAAYTFIYSQRSGTLAASLPSQVQPQLKKERLQSLTAIQNPISLNINEDLIGKTQKILVEGASKNNPACWYGRTDGHKIAVFIYDEQAGLKPGDITQVRIVAAQTWNLSGELL
ncbi:MAG: tRNA (N6-isopentenyl adenosine(37)-C2)-methylthiotransferase MiaB [Firmicutes bacterium]|nr:tRNA (N6-isopentenyl adenosine(37)-C2)-methylthiotransferase MiaB [Bacillota bacterium]